MKPISIQPKRSATVISGNLLLLLILLTATINAAAATFTVTNTNNTGAGSLRQAVLDAANAASADTIVFDATFNSPQTITLASAITIFGSATNTLTITGPGANLLTVSGNDLVGIFVGSGNGGPPTVSISGMTLTRANFSGAISETIQNLTVTNVTFASNTGTFGGAISAGTTLLVMGCTFTNNIANGGGATGNGGGAIYNSGTGNVVTISDSTFTGNTQTAGSGPFGGAIRISGGTANITNSTFANNTARNGGGAIGIDGVLNISGSTFTGNSTVVNTSAQGGAIYSFGQVTITNSVITGNSTLGNGGGISYRGAGSTDFLSLTDSTISNNTANSDNDTTGSGGGLCMTDSGQVSSSISGSTFSGNQVLGSQKGGGIYAERVFDMTNSTVSANSAGFGAGVFITNTFGFVDANTINFTNSTIAKNTNTGFGRGAGVYFQNTYSNVTVNLRNSIFADNVANTDPDLVSESGIFNSNGFNLIENTSGATIGGDTATNITGRDPNLGPLQNNGGPTLTHALLAGSPAVDKGGTTALIIDQRGSIRTFDNAAIPNAAGGNGTDIGAFEVELPVVTGLVSRKVHGGAGTFDINLLTTPPVTECRVGGAGGNYQVIVTFANPVSVSGLSIMSSNGLAGGTQTVNGAVVTVDLTAVANVQTLGITLINVNDGVRAGDVFIPVGVLVGDTTGNGSVSAADIGQVKGQSGQPVTSANFRTDVNVSGGSISAADIGLVKLNAGTQLP